MNTASELEPAGQLRALQIIVVALAWGVCMFAAVAYFVGPVSEPLPTIALGFDVLALVAIASTITMVPMAFLIPGHFIEASRRHATEKRIAVFRSSRILAAALIEGPALLWCVALLLTGTWWYLAPIVMLVGLLAMQIPTRGSFEDATGARVASA